MALAQPLVTGHGDEWALVRRHESEKMAGVQVAGGFPNRMVPVAEMLAKEVGNGIDFVDVNLVSTWGNRADILGGWSWKTNLCRGVLLIWYSTKERGVLVSTCLMFDAIKLPLMDQ